MDNVTAVGDSHLCDSGNEHYERDTLRVWIGVYKQRARATKASHRRYCAWCGLLSRAANSLTSCIGFQFSLVLPSSL